MDDSPMARRSHGQPLMLDLDESPQQDQPGWEDRLLRALAMQDAGISSLAEEAVRAQPGKGEVLLLSATGMLLADQPERALTFLKRHEKRFIAGKPSILLTALAYAQQRQISRAKAMLTEEHLDRVVDAWPHFPAPRALFEWLAQRLLEIRRHGASTQTQPPALVAKPAKPTGPAPRTAAKTVPRPALSVPDLPRSEAQLSTSIDFGTLDSIRLSGAADPLHWYHLRGNLTQLGLFQGFDELLCLPTLQGVATHWYQVETVRKVLKQYRGRVLLADEVGLGKTIEAGMVLKEYILRGMADRILVLTPAALVGQWREEMAQKFGIECATTHDALLRSDPASFWEQKKVIASIAAARRKDHAELLAANSYDVVIVDEAHHLRDQSSASYRLVNSLQKRFLLLLSATPVQNNLIELYNLLTLLQPGIFKTPKEFRAAHMLPGKPREPVNRDKLRDLMRGVMVRNTRALAALRLPRRSAATFRATPNDAEAACYATLGELTRTMAVDGQHRLAVQHLLAAAGSSPAAATGTVARFLERHPGNKRWEQLLRDYAGVSSGAKQDVLLDLLRRNPEEKKMVFVHHRDSMTHLASLLRQRGIQFATFDGSMSGPDKDAAVAVFRDAVPILMCSESGGEGRNLQFCNTLINFDIPWNPMAIEQRIGRIDRIGQTREVFVFNLATAGTIEDQVLRILDEKINMFELVVGEVGAILGELDEQQDFSTMVLDAWLAGSNDARAIAFDELEAQLSTARRQYEGAKQLDDALFGNDLDAG